MVPEVSHLKKEAKEKDERSSSSANPFFLGLQGFFLF